MVAGPRRKSGVVDETAPLSFSNGAPVTLGRMDNAQTGRDLPNTELYLPSFAPVNSATAASVVCAALRPSRKSLSLYVE